MKYKSTRGFDVREEGKVFGILLNLLKLITCIFLFYFLFTYFILDSVVIEDNALSPLIKKGDRFLTLPSRMGIKNPFTEKYIVNFPEIKRGEIVLSTFPNRPNRSTFFDYFLSFLTFSFYDKNKNSASMVRQVAGIEGDEIFVSNYKLYRRTLGKTVFIADVSSSELTKLREDFRVYIKRNEYFVISFSNSYLDSTHFGLLKRDNIKSVLFIQYFPLEYFILMKIKIESFLNKN